MINDLKVLIWLASLLTLSLNSDCQSSINIDDSAISRIHLPTVVNNSTIKLDRPGKGTIRFFIEPLPLAATKFTVNLQSTRNETVNFTLDFTSNLVSLVTLDGYNFKTNTTMEPPLDLLRFDATSISLWISFFSSSVKFGEPSFIKVGIGYVMENNTMVVFTSNETTAKESIGQIDKVNIDPSIQLASYTRYDREALIQDSPPLLVVFNEMTLDNVQENFVTSVELPLQAQVLYSKIAGAKVKLNDTEIESINYSLDNDGCCLKKILKNKELGYIRATFHNRFGNSPGHPFVLEIWPKKSHSPIHNHGDTVAVIKMLHGCLKSEWFNPLPCNSNDSAFTTAFMWQYLKKGEITWMTPDAYQTHRLSNADDDTAAISIQAYSNLNSEILHEEKFNFIGDDYSINGTLRAFYPTPDIYIDELLRVVQNEYRYKTCNSSLFGIESSSTKPSLTTMLATAVSMLTLSFLTV
jgi:hypothetical protein